MATIYNSVNPLNNQIYSEDTFTTAPISAVNEVIDKKRKSKSIETTPKNKPKLSEKPNKTQLKKQYSDFIKNHYITDKETQVITNTKIGGGKLSPEIKGGSFHISDQEYPEFLNLYANVIIKNKEIEYLTEKHLTEKCPILVDFDFRFDIDLETRVYTQEHIQDMIFVYQTELKKIYQFDESSKFDIFIFEKATINKVLEKNVTKDGIHMIIGIQMSHHAQMQLRKMVMPGLKDIWSDLPLKNTWEDVLDLAITNGDANWQLYGSRKPNHEPYQLTHVYNLTYDVSDGELILDEMDIEKFDVIQNIYRLSARYADHPLFFYKNEFIDKLNESSSSSSENQRKIKPSSMNIMPFSGYYPDIKSKSDLDNAIQSFLDSIGTAEYELREAYEYTMILPKEYYDEGSYAKWIRVGWALRNISDRLYVVWIAFCAKQSRFDYKSVPDLLDRWLKFDLNNPNGLTKYSLIHWAKIDAPKEQFKTILEKTIDYYIDLTLGNADSDKKGGADYDIALVVFQIYKDEYKCVSITGNVWYRYQNHRWKKNDGATSLRNAMSTVVRDLYRKKGLKVVAQQQTAMDEAVINDDEKMKKIKEARLSKIGDICRRLASTGDKQRILTECKDLFYDDTFFEKLDVNPYLLCCNNGVVDFKEKIFRRGYPEDYLSKSTKIDYIPINQTIHQLNMQKIHEFMKQLFPVPELCKYMWEHLASTLIGTCQQQSFNMYIGIGQNGKSILITFMEMILGDYKGDVPLSVVTDKRIKIGGLAPELVALKGCRYAVMQEPSKGDKLNEGVMKQLTGGDFVQARAPYMPEIITFKPQFKLVVCSNQFMEIKSQDNGTWRRIRVVDFMSLFTANPVDNDKEKPYQFTADENIKDKFEEWKELFLAMLVQRAFETGGIVSDCPIVMQSSESYKASQDCVSQFINDYIVIDNKARTTKGDLNGEFSMWYEVNKGKREKPNVGELHAAIDKKFGKYSKTKKAWMGIRMIYENDTTNANDTDDEDGADNLIE